MTKRTAILMYHALEDGHHPSGLDEPGTRAYTVSTDNFTRQMRYLHESGFRTISLRQLMAGQDLPERSVVITFDDGHLSNHTLALPILKSFAFTAEFFITTGWIGTDNFLLPQHICALHAAGMGIGSHGLSHSFLADCPSGQIHHELQESQIKLTNILGQPITSLSAPGGRISSEVVKVGRELGYRIFCASSFDLCHGPGQHPALPRLPITKSTSLTRFKKLVAGDVTTLLHGKARALILQALKKALGNKEYARCRAELFRTRAKFFT